MRHTICGNTSQTVRAPAAKRAAQPMAGCQGAMKLQYPSPPTPPSGDVSDPMHALDAAIDTLDFVRARELAAGFLHGSALPVLPDLAARARLRLARCDFAQSRFQRARAGALSAARALEQTPFRAEEVDAFSLAAHAAALQSRCVEAVETALIACRLAAELPPGPHTVRAELARGIAHGWGGAMAQAGEALETANHACARHGSATARLEIAVERLWLEAFRPVEDGPRASGRPTDEALNDVLKLCGSWSPQASGAALTPGATASLRLSAAIAAGLAGLRFGRVKETQPLLAEALADPGRAPALSWLLAARGWLSAEQGFAAGQLDVAAMHAARLCAVAREIDVALLAVRGHALAGEIARAAGRADDAVRQFGMERELRQAVLVRQLESCGRHADAWFQARQSEGLIRQLSDKSSTYWKWAHEDALTGIANLRRFNECLSEWAPVSQDAGEPLFVAVIDVDKFKTINDTFLHETGDAVLREIARQMTLQVRETDLAARWGGDEFAILFRAADLSAACAAGERLQTAVRDHDWSALKPGLRVGISVGIVEARHGESKQELRERADAAMYAQKAERRRQDIAARLPPHAWTLATSWLRNARRVIVVVGSAARDPGCALAEGVLSALGAGRRSRDQPIEWAPAELLAAWTPWRAAAGERPVPPVAAMLAQLSRCLPDARFITERVDGLLARAGIHDAMELYGNGFRDRCSACRLVSPSRDGGLCLSCGSPAPTIRPDVVMPGEPVDQRLHAAAELAVKRADVVLAIDCDGSVSPSLDLFEKARVRGARIIVVGEAARHARAAAHLALQAPSTGVLEGLVECLQQPPSIRELHGLSPAGSEIASFLGKLGTDDMGTSLEQALAWKDHEIDIHLPTLAWMFPLPTPSRINPHAPSPTLDDFRLLARDEPARQGARQSFLRMLRYYGFAFRDGAVVRQERTWEQGFSIWVLNASAHDMLISRMLGALRRLGLVAEARAFLSALTPEVQHFRGARAAEPLAYWRIEAGATEAAAV
jgi:diguanylate cyclase (GGDEF)-like protein